jgi:hypothetical protein
MAKYYHHNDFWKDGHFAGQLHVELPETHMGAHLESFIPPRDDGPAPVIFTGDQYPINSYNTQKPEANVGILSHDCHVAKCVNMPCKI